jgi:hypothetical protein
MSAGRVPGRPQGGVAPSDATFITQTPSGGLSAEQAMSLLGTGLVKNTTATGVQSIGVRGTDFISPADIFESAIAAFADSLIAFANPCTIFDHDLQTRWGTPSVASSGAITQGALSKIIATSGATGGGAVARTYGSSLGSAFPNVFPGGTTGKWYLEFRARLTTAVSALAIIGVGDETVLDIGARASIDTGFYGARSNNGPTALKSTIAVDTSFHRFRAYRNGVTGFFQVDSEAPLSSAAFFPTADCRLQIFADNGGTAAANAMEYDYIFVRQDPT